MQTFIDLIQEAVDPSFAKELAKKTKGLGYKSNSITSGRVVTFEFPNGLGLDIEEDPNDPEYIGWSTFKMVGKKKKVDDSGQDEKDPQTLKHMITILKNLAKR